MISRVISELVSYAENKGLIQNEDREWAVNRVLEILNIDEYEEQNVEEVRPVVDILNDICDYAADNGLMEEDTVTYRDLFDTKIMGALVPMPSEVSRKFWELYKTNPREATDWYYDFSKNTNYIRIDRTSKDVKWKSETEYGELDITINLSKPEKDPKAIALAKTLPQSSYPKCLLCKENVGYAGTVKHPARQNHRVMGITINDCKWFLQYSPYFYYNEHCIVFNSEHLPMVINHDTFRKLLDFVIQFPHYFVGSNADLPIVGGSILSHDHFQGGRYTFAMEKASIEEKITFKGFEDVESGIVRWPMSVIRICSEDDKKLVELASKILDSWRGYSDETAFIFAETDGEPHNTITPIARYRDGKYELDLVLRNNITTEEHPLGVFHPHEELHHIKKENIGLIEVMGLAVLPARLKNEIEELEKEIIAGSNLRDNEELAKHADWIDELKEKYEFTSENVDDILKKEIGKVFMEVLEHAGVYKRDENGKEAFMRFINSIN